MGRLTVLLAVAATGCESTGGETVGPRGGLVVSEDGRLSLEIPEHALRHEVEITIDVVDCDQPDAIGPCYAVGPRGTAFRRPVLLTYELGDMALEGVDPRTLGIVAEHGDEWRVLADREVDMLDGILVSSAMYLSEFAIVPVL